MRTRHPATALAAVFLGALTACGATDTPADKSSTEATPAATAKTYTFTDCVALLDYDFTGGQPQDASQDPECSHLTPDEYAKAVGEVLTKHKDEILGTPTNTP